MENWCKDRALIHAVDIGFNPINLGKDGYTLKKEQNGYTLIMTITFDHTEPYIEVYLEGIHEDDVSELAENLWLDEFIQTTEFWLGREGIGQHYNEADLEQVYSNCPYEWVWIRLAKQKAQLAELGL